MIARLEDRAVIALGGPDARSLIQGLITNDIERLEPGRALYAALLTPQGKILFDFIVAEGDGAVLLDCAAEVADALAKRLTLYRLRAKVEIERRDQLVVLASWDDTSLPVSAFTDPRLAALGTRTILAEAEMPVATGSAEDYRAHRLDLGVPEGVDFGQEQMFALDAGLEELHGVDFEKGCYVGQELTARMKHRGTARKRLLPAAAADGAALPAPGTAVTAGGPSLGEIVSTYGARGFALIRLDRLDEAGGAPLAAADKAVTLSKPRWLFP
jgi:folate-binding protein YgfZ